MAKGKKGRLKGQTISIPTPAQKAAMQQAAIQKMTAQKTVVSSSPMPSAIQPEIQRLMAEAEAKHNAGDSAAAAEIYRRILSLDQNNGRTWLNLGIVLRISDKHQAAAAALRHAVALLPNSAAAWTSYGNGLRGINQFEEAEAAHRKALSLDPKFGAAAFNLGLVLRDLGRINDAIAMFKHAVDIGYPFDKVEWDLSLAYLTLGDLANGFKHYEARWRLGEAGKMLVDGPMWDGSDLTGKTIMITAEQGFGDTIQFVRYAALLKQKGAKVIVACQGPLVSLFARTPGVDLAVDRDRRPLPPHDTFAPLLSLPRLLGTTLQNIPNRVPYVFPASNSPLKLQVPHGTNLKVGLVWAGKPSFKNDRNRSVGLLPFLRLMSIPGVRFYGFQIGPRVADLDTHGVRALIDDQSPRIKDFADTAALLQQVDLVITSDTSMVHLAGALGRPVWVALTSTGDWRCVHNRDDSIWYPTMRLFRQKKPGDWDDVFDRIQDALAARAGAAMPEAGGNEIRLDSATKTADGRPRFFLPLPKRLLADAGVSYLQRYESTYGGYEWATRNFFDQHMKPGDSLIDVGAHWGVFALSAATLHPGQIKVLAIEPMADNVARLKRAIAVNRLEKDIEVLQVACGAKAGQASMLRNSTMGHQITLNPNKGDIPVVVASLDEMLSTRPAYKTGRLFLKFDVEGHEPEALSGSLNTLKSGRVAAIIWERGRNYDGPEGEARLQELLDMLTGLGYTHWRFPSDTLGGPLLPFVITHELCNIYSLPPDFKRLPHYSRPPGPAPMPPRTPSIALPEPARANLTQKLMDVKVSDAGRWADIRSLTMDVKKTNERALLASNYLGTQGRILDLGAGLMALRMNLPVGCSYRPADLVRWDASTVVADFNQGWLPPADSAETAVLLSVLEYLHDAPSFLRGCRDAAKRLVLYYDLQPDQYSRRVAGYFNDYNRSELEAAIKTAGWRVTQAADDGGSVLLVAEA